MSFVSQFGPYLSYDPDEFVTIILAFFRRFGAWPNLRDLQTYCAKPEFVCEAAVNALQTKQMVYVGHMGQIVVEQDYRPAW